MLDKIKKRIYKLLGIRYWRRGKCKQCGSCCRAITFSLRGKMISRDSELDALKKFAPETMQHFYLAEKADNGVYLFGCKYLTEDNKCKVYYFRSLSCWLYPHFSRKFIKIGGQPLDGCGFYYEPVEKFIDVIGLQDKHSL